VTRKPVSGSGTLVSSLCSTASRTSGLSTLKISAKEKKPVDPAEHGLTTEWNPRTEKGGQQRSSAETMMDLTEDSMETQSEARDIMVELQVRKKNRMSEKIEKESLEI
jgi:hypothetical protein